MKITELMSKLEAQVEDAQKKQKLSSEADAAQKLALENYSKSLAVVETLKKELTDSIGNIFPDARVRQA